MSDYTPTTEEVRDDYVLFAGAPRPRNAHFKQWLAEIRAKRKSQFDRWLAEVKAQAWEEGFDAGERDVHEHELTHWDDSDCIQNPYRKDTK